MNNSTAYTLTAEYNGVITRPRLSCNGRPRGSAAWLSGSTPKHTVNCRTQVRRPEAHRRGISADLVRLTDHLPAHHTAARKQRREHAGPVVAARPVCGQSLTILANLGRPAELADHHYQGRIKQPTRFQIIKQRRHPLVERRQEPARQLLAILGMGVPSSSSFPYSPARSARPPRSTVAQQERLPKRMTTIAVTRPGIFLLHMERLLNLAGRQQ